MSLQQLSFYFIILLYFVALSKVNGQQNGPPKILPIAAADSYPEASTVNLICTVSGGLRNSLVLTWIKDENVLMNNEQNDLQQSNVSIDKTGGDISILRIFNASHENSGKYTCLARNSLGEDSTSVNIIINVEMKWTKVPFDTSASLNQDIKLECDAIGQPMPTITWIKHQTTANVVSSQRTSVIANNVSSRAPFVSSSLQTNGKVLRIPKAKLEDSGVYECIAKNAMGPDLRRIIQLTIKGCYQTCNYTNAGKMLINNLPVSVLFVVSLFL